MVVRFIHVRRAVPFCLILFQKTCSSFWSSCTSHNSDNSFKQNNQDQELMFFPCADQKRLMFPKYSGALGYPVFTNVPMILHSKLKSMRRCHHFREDPDGHAENRQSHDPEEFLCHHGTDRPPHSKINTTGVCHEVMGCCFNKTIGSESPAQLPLARRFRLADGPCGVTLFCTACGFFRSGITRQKMELSGVGRLAS